MVKLYSHIMTPWYLTIVWCGDRDIYQSSSHTPFIWHVLLWPYRFPSRYVTCLSKYCLSLAICIIFLNILPFLPCLLYIYPDWLKVCWVFKLHFPFRIETLRSSMVRNSMRIHEVVFLLDSNIERTTNYTK